MILFAKRISADKRGAAAIELALAAPFLGALIIGMADMATVHSLKLVLEQAAQRAIEQVEQQKGVATSYNTALTNEATAALADAGYTTNNTITPDSWLECSTSGTTWTRQTSFTGACSSTEMTARYVRLTISRKYTPIFTSKVWPNANTDGTITVSGYAVVRVQ